MNAIFHSLENDEPAAGAKLRPADRLSRLSTINGKDTKCRPKPLPISPIKVKHRLRSDPPSPAPPEGMTSNFARLWPPRS